MLINFIPCLEKYSQSEARITVAYSALLYKYSTLLSRHYLRATVYWGPFEDFSKASSETLQLLRTITNISNHVRKFSEDFRTLPKISENFPKILKNHKNIGKLVLNRFRSFPKISEYFRTLTKISEDFPSVDRDVKPLV